MMCAIAGILDLPVDIDMITVMLATMRRRGPDGKGFYQHQDATLLHTRLSIIDPSGGAQPMVLDWGRERYVISYNGELYNTAELRQELQRLGHSFYGHSDTEVLLHGYAQWREGVLEKLNGIYAFAVLEEQRGQVFLARDRMGVKPLFYRLQDGGLLFASEIKTILAYPGVEAQLDETGIGELLLLGPGRTPGSGVFRGIREIEPGCCGVYRQGKLSIRRYWKLKDREHRENLEDTAEKVRELVTDAIRRQMVSDVSIGTFLSGGLDSSIISAVCAREMDSQGKKLDTFSVDYLDNDKFFVPGKFQPNADSDYIRLMVDTLDTRHHWSILTTEDLLQHLEAATVARDLPGMADIDSSLLAFCGHIRPQVKVALSGECADEIFGGYPWFRDPQIRDAEGFPWAQNTEQREKFLHPSLAGKLKGKDFVGDRYAQSLSECDILPGNSPTERRMKQMVNLNLRWFMQTLLDRKDRMSMYHGLEVRVPFCDVRIAEYLYGVPWELKDHRGQEKGLLRYAMQSLLPQCVLYRRKSPYPKTHHPQYLQTTADLLRQVMTEPSSPILQIVDRSALEDLLLHPSAAPWYGQLMTGPQTMVYMLQINFWLKHYCVKIL